MEAKNLFQKALPFLFTIAVFYMLISCVPASVYSGDDGETITASCTLGIQHPPGYPLFSLIGKIFSFIPVGEPAFRVCLAPVFFASLNFLLIYLFFSRLLPVIGIQNYPYIFRFLPSFIYAAGFTIFQQSIIVKGGIYTLNNFFTILLSLILLEMLVDPSRRKWLFLFSLVFGLSLGNHLMIEIITLPAYAFILLSSGALKQKKPRDFATAAFFFLCGTFIYSYLPLRAGSAVLNWGDPSTPENFFQVLTRWQYVGGEIAKSFGSMLAQFVKFFSAAGYAMLWAGLFFAAFGAAFLFRRSRPVFAYLLIIPAMCLLAVTFYLNLAQDKIYIMETYITPVYFPFSVMCVLGIYFILKKLPGPLKANAFKGTAAAVLALFAFQALYFYPKLDKSRYFSAYDYVRNILDSTEENSILFLTGDGVVFPCWYLQIVKKYRPDVASIGTAVLPMQWVRDGVKRMHPHVQMPLITLKKIGTESTGRIIDAIIKKNFSTSNLYFSYNKPEENALDKVLTLMPKGIVYKVVAAEYAYVSDKYLKALENIWKFYRLRAVNGTLRRYNEDKARNIYASDYAVSCNQAGTFLEDNLFYTVSLGYFEKASSIAPWDHEFVYNTGNAYYNLMDFETAISRYKKSISMDPKYENARFNLGVTYYTMKRYPEAIAAFEELLRINPARRDVQANINLIRDLINSNN